MSEKSPFDVESWREAIVRAPEPELGAVHWPRVLGWALDEIEHLRAQLGAVEVLRADCASLSRQTNAAGRAYGHAVRRIDDILLAR